MIKKILFYIILLTALFTCNCNEIDDEDEIDYFPEDELFETEIIDTGPIDRIISSFSTSVEMAAVIENLNVPFSKNYIVPANVANNYETNFKKALGLGFYSSDLGYLNIYKKTNSILEYLKVIKRLSDDLDIDQFFDFQTLKRLATNREDLDSLMFLSVSSYNRMSKNLRETSRSDLSALMVTGVWLEGLYLACKVNNFKPTQDLKERIGSQKVILRDLMDVIKFFKKKPDFAKLIRDFEQIEEAYEEVTITIEKGKKEEIMIDGIPTTVQGDFTVVTVSDEQLKEISELIIKIRNKLISY